MGDEVIGTRPPTQERTDVEQWLNNALAQTSLADPELLARLIYWHAGPDLEAQQVGLEAEVVVVRRLLSKKLKNLRSAAQAILDTSHERREISAMEIAMSDIISGPQAGLRGIAAGRKYIERLTELVSIPIRSNLSEFGEKPELDLTTTRIVVAIAEYCRALGIEFGGPPKRQQADNKAVLLVKSKTAVLVEEVLNVLSIHPKPTQIATHIKKAQAALPK